MNRKIHSGRQRQKKTAVGASLSRERNKYKNSKSNIWKNKKASDFSEAFFVVAVSIEKSNQFVDDYYNVLTCTF